MLADPRLEVDGAAHVVGPVAALKDVDPGHPASIRVPGRQPPPANASPVERWVAGSDVVSRRLLRKLLNQRDAAQPPQPPAGCGSPLVEELALASVSKPRTPVVSRRLLRNLLNQRDAARPPQPPAGCGSPLVEELALASVSRPMTPMWFRDGCCATSSTNEMLRNILNHRRVADPRRSRSSRWRASRNPGRRCGFETVAARPPRPTRCCATSSTTGGLRIPAG